MGIPNGEKWVEGVDKWAKCVQELFCLHELGRLLVIRHPRDGHAPLGHDELERRLRLCARRLAARRIVRYLVQRLRGGGDGGVGGDGTRGGVGGIGGVRKGGVRRRR